MKKQLRAAGLSVLLLILGVTPVLGQSTATGTLTGIVRDGNGGVLPGVTVTALQPLTGLTRNGVSGTQGEWTLPTLPPGDYTLTFELAAFKKLVRPNVSRRVRRAPQRERDAGNRRHLGIDHRHGRHGDALDDDGDDVPPAECR